jgi:hypothetical protein
MTAATHDTIVIGSSPLMVLHATRVARGGSSVCVLDKSPALGGAWQTRQLANGHEVEIGCHLLEYFPGIYEMLEQETGLAFAAPVTEPIRVGRNGAIFPYHSRILLLLAALRMAARYGFHGIARFVDGAHKSAYLNYRSKLSWFLRHQLGALIDPKGLRFPVGGFAQFNQTILANARAAGVQFRQFDVSTIELSGGVWTVQDNDGARLAAPSICCTSSASLRHAGPGRFARQNAANRIRHSLVIRIPRQDTAQEQPYAAFWKDPYISRVSLIANPNNSGAEHLFLIELRAALLATGPEERQTIIEERLHHAGILKPRGHWETVELVSCELLDTAHQLGEGEIDDGFVVLSSNGNLAGGLAGWQQGLARRRAEPGFAMSAGGRGILP